MVREAGPEQKTGAERIGKVVHVRECQTDWHLD